MYKTYMRKTPKLWWMKSKSYINGDIPYSWIGTLNNFKMSVLPNLGFNTIPIKIPANYFGCQQTDSEAYGKTKDNTILKKDGKLAVLGFKTYCKSKVIKIVWYWWKNKQIDNWIEQRN